MLDLVGLTALMRRTAGDPGVVIGLIDGPVDTTHKELASAHIRTLGTPQACDSLSCHHGTMVAGILSARRGGAAPAICPDCTLLLRPIFTTLPSSSSLDLAAAIVETVDAGARIINLSAGLPHRPKVGEADVTRALNYSARRGTIVVVAAGNQSQVGGSCITQHPWVIPVVSCDAAGHASRSSTVSAGIGRHGLRAPGESIPTLSAGGGQTTFSGTSAACPFVTGAIALLWSEFPSASAAQMRAVVAGSAARRSVVPPLLNAAQSFEKLAVSQKRRSVA